jgi:D-proline reductase (dithiol) PrdB
MPGSFSRLKNRLIAKVLTRFPALFERSTRKISWKGDSGIPWTPFTKKLSASKVAIVTTAGVHLKTQKPFDMLDKMGDPEYRELPVTARPEEYTITHDYYDHADADRDLNIVFPLDRLKEMKEAGEIDSLAGTNYGFMGHIDGPHIDTLIKKTAPEVARKLKKAGVDVVLLTPG